MPQSHLAILPNQENGTMEILSLKDYSFHTISLPYSHKNFELLGMEAFSETKLFAFKLAKADPPQNIDYALIYYDSEDFREPLAHYKFNKTSKEKTVEKKPKHQPPRDKSKLIDSSLYII